MASLPRSILGGFSRVFVGRRRHDRPPMPLNTVQHHEETLMVAPEWMFLASFERRYGSTHPFFYACRLVDALKIAKDERKFVFVYLHSPDHPFTPSFCRETLCSEVVVQYLDTNFVSWGALADSGEGLQMVAMLRPSSFPFCALVASATGDSMAVLQQMEGPISPAELVEILERTVEEQGLGFGGPRARAKEESEKRIARAKQEEKIRADRQLRAEQDAAYLAALQIDKEKERLRNNLPSGRRDQKPVLQASNTNIYNKGSQSHEKLIRQSTSSQKGDARVTASGITTRPPHHHHHQYHKDIKNGGTKDPQITQILIRFPNGERREHSFFSTDKIQSVYRYIDSQGLPGVRNYKLISSFPRKIYGVDQMGITLKDAGLHPKATLFLELQ